MGYFVMQWNAKIKSGADLSAYDKDGDGVKFTWRKN